MGRAAAYSLSMLQLSCLSGLGFLDAGVADCDGSCGLDDGGGPCLLHSGLCCPGDKLDDTVDVIEFINNEEFLEDLAIAASLPPGTELLLPTAVDVERGCQGVSSAGGAPRLPSVRSPLSSSDNSSWTASHRTYSSLAAAPPPPPSPPIVSRLIVPKRKRDRSVMRGRRQWSLDMPNIIPKPHAANPSSSGDSGVRQESLVPRPPTIRQRVQRACSHCDSTETPQWRAGPDGPGTLCNACGLRYSLNKLLPEYRPSTSPSFQSDKHSNRHRKVVKLRERNAKDTVVVSMPPAPPGDNCEFKDVV